MKERHLLLLIICFFLFTKSLLAQLSNISSFGNNLGNLSMYLYTPTNVPNNAPVVIALHGCTQSASQFATETAWNTLAEQYKFYVIYPEQKAANNANNCFNWFQTNDINKGQGEVSSVKSMLDYVQTNYNIDSGRVYVTGLSAGAAMTACLIATYPESFAGGAIMAGLPYGTATSVGTAFTAMSSGINKTPNEWGNLVRNQNPNYSGSLPRVVIFHGTDDLTVSYNNVAELVEQWTNVHGIDATADIIQNPFNNNKVSQAIYNNAQGTPLVMSYSINSLGHAVAIDIGNGQTQGGALGSYTKDVDLYACYWALDFWGITGNTPPITTTIGSPSNLSARAVGKTQISLSWTDNADNEHFFILERASTTTNNFGNVAILPANTTHYLNTNLTQNTPFTYRIFAQRDTTKSALSNTATATTGERYLIFKPAPPNNFIATPINSNQIDLSWGDNANNETGYILQRSKSLSSRYQAIAQLASNTTSYIDTDLATATKYYYRICSFNDAGQSLKIINDATTSNLQEHVIEQAFALFYISTFNLFNCGQSFTLSNNSQLTKIEVNNYNSINTTLRIYAGDGVSGTPIYEQSNISLASGWQAITLTTPLSLQAGQYTFELTEASFAYINTNAYSGGQFWYNGTAYSVFDAAFRITVVR